LNLNAGNYTVVATRDGFQPAQEQFALLSTGISDGLIRMEPLARIAKKPEGRVLSAREAQIPSEARKFFEQGTEELYKNKRPENSVSDFLKAIEIYPAYDQAYLELGIAYGRLARPEEAEKILRKGIQVYAQNAQAHLFLGKLLKEQGKMPEAVEEMEKALGIDDTLWLAHLDLARILEKQRKPKEAYEHARRAHELNSAVQDVHLAFYNACIGTGDYAGALAELDEVLKLYPDSDAARKLQALRPKLAADAAAMKH
jgi:tetratricopeptide (TPR) repeat protein